MRLADLDDNDSDIDIDIDMDNDNEPNVEEEPLLEQLFDDDDDDDDEGEHNDMESPPTVTSPLTLIPDCGNGNSFEETKAFSWDGQPLETLLPPLLLPSLLPSLLPEPLETLYPQLFFSEDLILNLAQQGQILDFAAVDSILGR